MVRRRELLRLAGFGAAAGILAACDHAAGPALAPLSSTPYWPAATPTSTPHRPAATPTSTTVPDWSALRSRLSGELRLPGDGGYDVARRSYNPLFDARRPAAVVRCARPEDVQTCVELARSARMPTAARSGGHSYAGYSTPERGLVVDLGGLAEVDVRPDGTAVVGAGARLIDLYAALAKAGRCLPAGSCPSVGIAGLTLGGGQGVLTRYLGLTCDRLRSARVVTADAALRTASADSEPELFWALRGGGGGNFGVVTSFTFDTAPAPDLTVFSLPFPGGSVADVLGAWQEWQPAAPAELWSNCVVSAGMPASCRVGGCFVGTPQALNPLLNDFVRRAGTAPTSRLVWAKGYLDAMLYFAGCSDQGIEQCRPRDLGSGAQSRQSFVASSRVLQRPTADPGGVARLLGERSGLHVMFDALGGAAGRLAADATAFPHRDALAIAQVYHDLGDASREQAVRFVGDVQQGLAELVGAGAYVNYIDPAQQDWALACYRDNLPRLRQVARRYDPDGVFAFPQGLATV